MTLTPRFSDSTSSIIRLSKPPLQSPIADALTMQASYEYLAWFNDLVSFAQGVNDNGGGPAGPQGITGLLGPSGPIGPQGITGLLGPSGPIGPQGIPGIQGDVGSTGLDGPTGIQGVTGAGILNFFDQTTIPNPYPSIPVIPVDSMLFSETDCALFATIKGNPFPVQISSGAMQGNVGNTGAQGQTGIEGILNFFDQTTIPNPYPTIPVIPVDSMLFSETDCALFATIKGNPFPVQISAGSLQGATGLTGDTGAQGQTGVVGPAGLTGAPGAQGITGYQGITGVGFQGNTGFQGITGLPFSVTGIQGQTGSQGNTGFQGQTGVQGNTGFQGQTGVQGNTGLQGVTGLVGQTGAQGNTGVSGVTGLIGQTGSQGNTGLQGITGVGLQGQTGLRGSTGFQGTTGVQGTQGATGSQGNTGVQGIQGSTGVAGATGVQGLQGATGLGYTGLQGRTGVQGTAGTNGTNGTNGSQGSTGVAGPGNVVSPNYVPAVNPAGTAYINSIMVNDSSDGRIGIGTTSPGYLLDVNGAINGQSLNVITPYTTATISGIANSPNMRFQNLTGDITITPNSGAGTVNVSGSLDVTDNVGIGTTSPSYKLAVLPAAANTIGANIMMGQNVNNGDYASLGFGDPNGTTIYNEIRCLRNSTASSYDLSFSYQNWGGSVTEGMRISANGHVGIGTTSPPDLLTIQRSGSSSQNILTLQNEIGNNVHTLGKSAQAGIYSVLNNGTETIRLFSAGPSWFTSGNVGIGTASPQALVDVNGGGIIVRGTNAPTSGTMLQLLYSGGGYINAYNASTSSMQDLHLNGLLHMIASSGNVGIGTTSPPDLLTIQRSGSASQNILTLQNEIGNNVHTLGKSAQAGIYSVLNNGTETIRLFSAGPSWFTSGNVGIGTTSPGSTLHVNGRQTLDSAGNFELMANGLFGSSDTYLANGYAGRIEYNKSVGSWFFETAVSGTAGAGITYNKPMTILNGGFVGIGTTSPGYLLEVYNGAGGGNVDININTGGNGSDYLRMEGDAVISRVHGHPVTIGDGLTTIKTTCTHEFTQNAIFDQDAYTDQYQDFSSTANPIGWNSSGLTSLFNYKKVGKTVYIYFNIQGSSNGTTASFQLPYPVNLSVGTSTVFNTGCIVNDDEPYWIIGRATLTNGSSGCVLGYLNASSWNNSSTLKAAQGEFFYETV